MTENKLNAVPGLRPFFGKFGLFAIMMCYPLFSMLWRYEYPVLSMEVFLFLGSIFLLALLLSALSSACRPRLANIIFAIFLTLVLVLQFNLFFEGTTILFVIALALALILGSKFQQLAFAVFVALFIGAFIDRGLDHTRNLNELAGSKQSAVKAPIVHIMMDGFIGPDGLPPQDVPQEYRSEILGFFKKNDFELFNKAYSHYNNTQDSLTRAFNFTDDDENLFQKTHLLHEKLAVPENKYFEMLHRAGYTINVYQSESFDFCQAVPEAVGRCMMYNVPNLATIRDNVSSPWTRYRVLVTGLISGPNLIGLFLKKRLWLLAWGVTFYEPKVIDEIVNDLNQTRSGVYFAHLLLPHNPNVYQSDCQLDYSSDSWERFLGPGLIRNSPDSRAVRYLRYLPQLSCALKEMGRLFARMREMGLYDDATIIVHGDHGSRISLFSPSHLNRERLTPEDYRDVFSILFAIKTPSGEYREHNEPVPLNVLMQRTAAAITGDKMFEEEGETQSEELPFIYLTGQSPLTKHEIDIFEQP
ncbi:sulfatase-like hydrolase/transferase [Pseudomonadota bacterium]